MSRECESVRGEWGGICPDCGERLPPWAKATKITRQALEAVTEIRDCRADGCDAPVPRNVGGYFRAYCDAHKTGQASPHSTGDWRARVAAVVREHGGDREAAARDLGVTRKTVGQNLRWLGVGKGRVPA